MVGKRQLEQDPLVTVVVPNTAARSLHLCQLFEELLKDNFESESSKLTGQVKICYDDSLSVRGNLDLSPSLPVMQWITKERDDPTGWKTEPFFLIFLGSNRFEELGRKTSDQRQFLKEVLQIPTGLDPFTFLSSRGRRARILVYNERKKPSASSGNPEVRRMEEKKLTKMVTWLEVMTEGLSFGRSLKPEECALAAVRATKSVIDAATKEDYAYIVTDELSGDQVVNWYPKKSGPPATVTKNESHTGLHLLWQKHLQQVSKRVGIEQAKVIASDPDFQSPHRLFETYRRASDERGESLLQSKQVRPSGSSRDIASLGSGACLGPDISKKVHTMFTVKGDGLTYLQDK